MQYLLHRLPMNVGIEPPPKKNAHQSGNPRSGGFMHLVGGRARVGFFRGGAGCERPGKRWRGRQV